MFKNLSTQALGIAGTQSEIIELAMSHGFRGLDLDIVDFQRQAETRGLAQSRRLIDSAKLKLGRFELPFEVAGDEPTYRAALERLAGQAKLAAELGCLRAVTRVAPASDELPYHQNFELHRKRFAEIADVLQSHGIRLAVGLRGAATARANKAFQFLYQLDPLVMLLGLVGKSNVGVALDLWDVHVSGGTIDDVRKLSARQIVTLGVADFPANADRTTADERLRLLPGESGQIDAASVLTWLAEQGYDGPVTPVADRSQFAGQRKDEIGRKAGKALDQVWKSAGLSPAGKLVPAQRK